MKKKSNARLIAVVVLLVALIGGVVAFLLLNKEEVAPEAEDLSGRELASHVVSYEENGIVRLYDVEKKKEVEKFDLKSLSEVKVTEVQKTVREEIKKPKKEKKKKEELGGYKDFDQIRVTIIKHDNAWNIQTALTPKRNTTKMLGYVRELNDGYKMHPIYPNEQYIFLKEKGDNSVDEEEIGIVIEEVIEAEPTYTEKVIVEKIEEKEDSYIYYRDYENGVVYAHSDFNNMVYKIEEEDGKLKIDKYLSHESVGNPTQLLVKEGHVIFGFRDEKEIYHLNDKKIKKVALEGFPESWDATAEQLIYSYEDFMGSYELKTGKQNHVLLGDATKDFVIQGSDAYVLNRFGEKTENNLLMKVNTKTLDVEDLVELETNKTSLVTKGDGEFVWVSGIKMTGSKSGLRVEDPQILAFTKEPFKMEKKDGWSMPFVSEGQVFDAHLYAREGELLQVYRQNSDVVPVELSVKGMEYLVIQ